MGPVIAYHGGGILTYHGGSLGPPRFQSYRQSPRLVLNGKGLEAVHQYHGRGFNLGKWFKKAGHTAVHWLGDEARKAGKTLVNAGFGAINSLGAAIPLALSGNLPGAGVALAGGAANGVIQGAIRGRGYAQGSKARASKRIRKH